MTDEPPLNLDRGFTVSVFFPRGCDPAWVSGFLDRVAEDAHGMPSDTLDAFVVGHAGDVLGIDGVAAPATPASGSARGGWLDVAKETLLAAEDKAKAEMPPGTPDGASGYAGESERLPDGTCPAWCPCHHMQREGGQ